MKNYSCCLHSLVNMIQNLSLSCWKKYSTLIMIKCNLKSGDYFSPSYPLEAFIEEVATTFRVLSKIYYYCAKETKNLLELSVPKE